MFYDLHADHFEKIPFEDKIVSYFEEFSPLAPGQTVLDIGYGPGTFALFMKENGYEVLCLDPSKEMSMRCRKKGLECVQTTLQEFETEKTFSIISALSSLIHISKEERQACFEKVFRLLKEDGILFLSMILGDFEGELDPTNTGDMRFFSFITEEELLSLVENDYTILKKEKIFVKKMGLEFLLLALQKSGSSL